ncbi:hypothetical protein JCM10207_003629 [Rhodosporidiobolus poonsookiae]
MPPPVAARDAAAAPSLAASLPYDVLLRIFASLPALFGRTVEGDTLCWPVASSCPWLRHCALVCAAWRAPAQHALWESVQFGSRAQVARFNETARGRRDFAAKCRAMCVGVWWDPMGREGEGEETEQGRAELSEAMVDAVSHCANIRSLQVRFLMEVSRERFLAVLDRLFLRVLLLKTYDTAYEIAGSASVAYPQDLYRLICKPTMRAFELNMRPLWRASPVPLAPPAALLASASPLTTLSVTVNAPELFPHLLSLCTPALRYLSVYTEHILDRNATEAALRPLAGLEEVRFESNIEADGRDPLEKGANLWLGEFIAREGRNQIAGGGEGAGAGEREQQGGRETKWPALRELSLSDQAATPSALLRALTPRIERVEYIQRSRTLEAILDEWGAALSPSASPDGGEAREVVFPESLAEVRLVGDDEALEPLKGGEDWPLSRLVERVEKAFEAKGVRLVVIGEEVGLCEIPRRRVVEM